MHESVLLKESIEALHIQKGERYIDATLGAGGHAVEILSRGGVVLGIEADPGILSLAEEQVRNACPPHKMIFAGFKSVLGNFKDIASLARAAGFERVSGVLFDLGISSIHLDTDKRGFSFKDPSAPLDMRLNPEVQGVRASDLLNSLDKTQLSELFESVEMARKVISCRAVKPFEKVGDFLSVFPKRRSGKTHPATKAFMMLRIAVNSEYENLQSGLPQAFGLLEKGGGLCVISFHSGEDRLVKNYFRSIEETGEAKLAELVLPTDEEVYKNPRARSARLRVAYKI